ncbi:peptidylprolyl isomerase [Pseudooceanicola sp. LIPI14-2-Ac024]|uniref:peptidylprolyl isomerase n=1 Tax=Pseudooceanicola sp. LIPI14-2-Ac024 TaxID=3344875 RepID=UPI0035CFA27C
MVTTSLLRAGLAAALLTAPLPLAAQSETATEPQTEAPATEAKAVDADTVVATVNGHDVTLGHMIMLRASLPQQYAQLPPEVLFKGVLDQIVQQMVLGQSLEGEAPRAVALSLDNERNARMATAAVADFLETAVTEEQIQAAYDAQYANVEGTEYKARHILVETEDEAKALIEELDGGADFATLAQEKSTGPSGPNGGDLGWFGPGMMVKPFEDAVMALEPGAHSAEPTETQFGWHVILLEETRDKAAPALDEVRGEIEANLQNAAVEAHIDALVEKSEIDRSGAEGIDPTVLTNTDLVE